MRSTSSISSASCAIALVDLALAAHLGIVAHPPQQTVGDARCAAAARRNLHRAILIDLDAQNFSGTLKDDLQVGVGVELQPQDDAEARAQRR